MTRLALTTIFVVALFACSPFPVPLSLPQSSGEINSGYSYIPIDPLPVTSIRGEGCLDSDAVFTNILSALPDNAVRVAVGKHDSNGTVTFGAAQLGSSGNTYQVILDYINADTANIRFNFALFDPESQDSKTRYSIYDEYEPRYQFEVRRLPSMEENQPDLIGDEVVVPVYVGVGLRLTASISVLRGTVNLASLGAIAVEAQSGRVAGSLVVQTLGITGEQVATILPLPSELDSTTVQNAILSLGAIKAIIYQEDSVTITPRVTGIYNPVGIGGQALVNAIVSELAREPIPWRRPCSQVQADL